MEPSGNGGDLEARALASVKWSSLGAVLARAFQPLILLVLARLLTPADFGVVGVAMVAINIAETLQDLGFGKTLIQTESSVETYANAIFWANLASSIILYGFIWIGSPWLAVFFKSAGSELILQVICLRIVVTGLTAVHMALLQRRLDFKQIFYARSAGAAATGLVSVPLAFAGFGAWSLVWGTVAGSVAQSALIWAFDPWRPSLGLDFSVLAEIFKFSGWVFLYNVMAILINVGDSAIVGHYLGLTALGFYRIGVMGMEFMGALLFAPLQPVAYSVLSRLQTQPAELARYYLKLTEVISSLCLPIGIGVAVLANGLVPAVLGAKWAGAAPVVSILALKFALDWMCGTNAAAFTAMGRPDLNARLAAIVLAISIPSCIWAAPAGLLVFCLVRLANGAIDNAINYGYVVKHLLHRHRPYWQAVWTSAAAALLMGAVDLAAVLAWRPRALWALGILVVVSAAAYAGLIRLLNRGYFGECRSFLFAALRIGTVNPP